ncbi:MAG: hypothetical protein HY822_19800 [Acidobacteria bacterium]|nr:hypothetical protein [Acidobacteriota bacterium]
MFFRRAKSRVVTFEERLEGLRQAGFAVQREAGLETRVSRGECAALVREAAPQIGRIGILCDGEIGAILDGGYQKFLLTPSGRKLPALASHLTALHTFEEDLREGLGLISLYNQSLGTVNQSHQYDRLKP